MSKMTVTVPDSNHLFGKFADIPVGSYQYASLLCRRESDSRGWGVSNWTETMGHIKVDGKVVAKVSYNGRVLALDGTLLFDPFAVV